ncbi:hypothetical protein GTA08_BOTSDO08555 [Botryosphaeria dothidea]|uniref:Uncharacterized protein n=1 Tax=Botryosphaeria dothidea TaxID=55169 RepID=A0A8H4IQX4_9PEZI|nr:hypothetical protein GTA08_BOTSDO08555 [Botryosphaeria dothidea]
MDVGLPILPASGAGTAGLMAAVGNPQGCQQVDSCTGNTGLPSLTGTGTTQMTKFECTTPENHMGQCGSTQNNVFVVVASINWETTSTNPDPIFNVILADSYKTSLPACVAIQEKDQTYSYQFTQGSTECFIDQFNVLKHLDGATVYLTVNPKGTIQLFQG